MSRIDSLIAAVQAAGYHGAAVSMVGPDGEAVWINHEWRLCVRPAGGVTRYPAPGGEEFMRRLRALEAYSTALVKDAARSDVEFKFEEKAAAFPPVAPWVAGELAMVLRKDEKGHVRRFADWVVQVLSSNASMQYARNSSGGGSEPWYMDWPSREVVHDSVNGEQPVILVKLPVTVRAPIRVSYGLEPSTKLSEAGKWNRVEVATVAMPEHWLRRLTATEAARIKVPRAGEPVVY